MILGAGTGGMPAAYDLRAAIGKEHRITVVNALDYFQFVPSNPWVAVGWRERKETTLPIAPSLAKKGIEEAIAGEIIEILTDNDTALCNLQNYLAELKLTPQLRSEGAVHTLTLVKPGRLPDTSGAERFCTTPGKDYIVVIKSDVMGQGDSQLGQILLRAFVNSLKEAALLPKAILLYNSGIKIALTGTDTAASLQELEEKGVAIIACGTCVDYYEVKNQLAVGMISNMFTLTRYMSEAGHIVYP